MHPLLAAILVAPDGDLAHHAVYADALQTRGDPRGELIAVELALAADPDHAELRARRAALRTAHGSTWWAGIPTQWVRTRHGFVEAIAIPAEDVDLAVALAAREPLRSLELVGAVSPDVLARVPPVRTLVMRDLTDDGMQALARAPCAETLHALDLAGSSLGTFAPGTGLPRLRVLSIAATWIEAGQVDAWAHVGELRALDISLPRDRTFETHRVLAAAPGLETLRASCVDELATSETLAALAAAPALRHLEARGDGAEPARLRAALSPAVTLDSALPARVSLDLVGRELAFTTDGKAFCDSAYVPLQTRFTSSDALSSSTQTVRDAPEPTRLLIEALACGAPRRLTPAGFEARANLLPWDHIVDAALEVRESHLDLELDYYID